MQGLSEYRWQREHCPSEQSGADYNFDCHRNDCLKRFSRDAWAIHGRAGIELHNAGHVRDRFGAGEREDDANKLDPKCSKTLMARLKEMRVQMRRANRD